MLILSAVEFALILSLSVIAYFIMSQQQDETPDPDADIELEKGPLRIRYEEDVGIGPSRRLTRRDSGDSLSIYSLSRKRSVDPAIALPIQYRTM